MAPIVGRSQNGGVRWSAAAGFKVQVRCPQAKRVALVFDSALLDADQQIRDVRCPPHHTLMSKLAANAGVVALKWLAVSSIDRSDVRRTRNPKS